MVRNPNTMKNNLTNDHYRQYHTRPREVACPPDPYPAHTAGVVCKGGTQSGSSPET